MTSTTSCTMLSCVATISCLALGVAGTTFGERYRDPGTLSGRLENKIFFAFEEIDKFLKFRSEVGGNFARDIKIVVDLLDRKVSWSDLKKLDIIDVDMISKVESDMFVSNSLVFLKELNKVLDPDQSVACSDRVTRSLIITNHYAMDPVHRLLKFRKKQEGGEVKLARLDYLIVGAARIQAQRCEPTFKQRESQGAPELDLVVEHFDNNLLRLIGTETFSRSPSRSPERDRSPSKYQAGSK